MSNIGLILLAAGASSRMGQPKQLLRYRGQSLIRHAIETARNTACSPILVVLGAYSEQIEPELSDLDVQIVNNPNWSHGISTSICVGIERLQDNWPNLDAAVLMLCDQPLISAHLINQFIEAYATEKWKIIAAKYQRTLGVPALFDQTLFPELTKLNGDFGAKSLIHQNIQITLGIDYPQGAVDLDTPENYVKFSG